MAYIIRRLNDCGNLRKDLIGERFRIPQGLDEAPICFYPWDKNGYRPVCGACVGWNDEGLVVFMYALEAETRAETAQTGGMVCTDSCLEFFVNPDARHSDLYLNYECSPRPCVFLSVGTQRHGRKTFSRLPKGMEPSSLVGEGFGWSVRYVITSQFLQKHFQIKLSPGLSMRGNFYKCGDLTPYPHFGAWNPIDNAAFLQPDFHRPEYFAPIILV